MSAQPVPMPRPAHDVGDIVAFLVASVADLIGAAPDSVDADAPLDSLALDSLEAVILTGDLSAWLGWEVDETMPWRVETLTELAAAVADEDARRHDG